MNKGFKDLIMWQKSIDFAIFIYKLCKVFPADEKFVMISQIQRAVLSISANIAEGYGRTSSKEFVRFLSISLGSSAEVESFVEMARRLEYIDQKEYDYANDLNGEIRRMIKSTIRTINCKMENV